MAVVSRSMPLRRLRDRHGFTLVELLVVVAIIGVLVALLLPAVQASREAARRTTCQNHLKQLGLALVEHESRAAALPVGCVGCKPRPPRPGESPPVLLLRSWCVELLPALEEQPLHDQIDHAAPLYDPANRPAVSQALPTLLCPSTRDEATHSTQGLFAGAAYSDYGGLYGVEGPGNEAPWTAQQVLADPFLGVLLYEEPTTLAQITDGASHTVAVAEVLKRRTAETEWANGHNVFAHENTTPVNGPSELSNNIGSPHPGGALAVFCDGHVEFLTDSLPQLALNAKLTRAGDEP